MSESQWRKATFAECGSKPVNAQTTREKIVQNQERTAYIDLRIGLNLLGENGRMLLAQYTAIRRLRKDSVPTS